MPVPLESSSNVLNILRNIQLCLHPHIHSIDGSFTSFFHRTTWPNPPDPRIFSSNQDPFLVGCANAIIKDACVLVDPVLKSMKKSNLQLILFFLRKEKQEKTFITNTALLPWSSFTTTRKRWLWCKRINLHQLIFLQRINT